MCARCEPVTEWTPVALGGRRNNFLWRCRECDRRLNEDEDLGKIMRDSTLEFEDFAIELGAAHDMLEIIISSEERSKKDKLN